MRQQTATDCCAFTFRPHAKQMAGRSGNGSQRLFDDAENNRRRAARHGLCGRRSKGPRQCSHRPRLRRRHAPHDSSRQWEFTADAKNIHMSAGFEPNKIYEVVYKSQDPPIAGLGPAAVRDTISKLKYGSAGGTFDQSGRGQARHCIRNFAERPLSSHLPLLRLQRRRIASQGIRRRDVARGRRRPRKFR